MNERLDVLHDVTPVNMTLQQRVRFIPAWTGRAELRRPRLVVTRGDAQRGEQTATLVNEVL